jgi:carboxylate-amine ligase
VPVAGYGGGRVAVGPECSPAELAELQAEVAAAPHRFVAREPVPSATAPALVAGTPAPRHVDLRIFSVATADGVVEVLPAPLSRVAMRPGSQDTDLSGAAAVKDSWVLTA